MPTKERSSNGLLERAARDFTAALSEARTYLELEEIFIERIKALGYQNCGYIRVFGEGRFHSGGFLFGSTVSGWGERYQARKYADVDPVIVATCKSSAAFTLEEVSGKSRDGAPILADARSFGLFDGLVAPVRGGYDDLGCVLIGSERAVKADSYDRFLLQGMCDAYGRAGLALLESRVDRPPLTDREHQCLRWVAAGRSDPQIGMILGLSPNTVHAHVESAKTKLGANSRAQLVLRAVMAGILRSEAF